MQFNSRIVNSRFFALITMKYKKLLDFRAIRARKDEEIDMDCRALYARKDEENDVDWCVLRARKDEGIDVAHSSWHVQRIAIIFLLCLVSSFGVFALDADAAQFSVGAGTAGDPYIVTTPTQLDAVRNFSDAHYKLGANIDLSSYLAQGGAGYDKWGAEGWLPIGNQVKYFTGSLDGAGHVITGLWISRSGTDYAGLFGHTQNIVIKNLGVKLAEAGVSGQYDVGGLVGDHFGGSIENCYSTGKVSGVSNVGGLVGHQYGSNIENSYAIGNVSGLNNIGGLVGHFTGNIEKSYSMGNVSGSGNSVGGLVGQFEGSIANCYATGNVRGGGNSVGGLVGDHFGGSITNSLATGDVSGDGRVGGLVGSHSGYISNSYVTGNVSGKHNVGGLVGVKQQRGRITNCYRYQFIMVNGAVISENTPNDNIYGGIVSASQLMSQETYAGNGWLFYPYGPWHWDSGGFPKLNIGSENYPFNFALAIARHPILYAPLP